MINKPHGQTFICLELSNARELGPQLIVRFVFIQRSFIITRLHAIAFYFDFIFSAIAHMSLNIYTFGVALTMTSRE